MNINIIQKSSTSYPDRLNLLHQPPKQVRTLGQDLSNTLKNPAIGIVGARKVTNYGRAVTTELAGGLSRHGSVVVSGMALGVDSIAHQAALDNSGKTVAVLPSGLKAIYPSSHRGLAKSILEKRGILVSEYDDNFIPRKESFIERNRIIAALSDALLVTEAAEKSGSLHTARFALELGKPVLAVPGNINSAMSSGTNNLIKMGARLVSELSDVLDELKIKAPKQTKLAEVYGDNEQETLLIKLLSEGATSGDELLKTSALDVEAFQQTLTMLEIKGVIAPLGNNNWHIK